MLVPLSEAPRERIGGKAAALRRLADRGLPVPPSWVLPYDAFAAVLAANGLRGDEPDLGERLLNARIPFALAPPPGPLAVRSSADGEDGLQRSHAGLYRSVLGVEAAGFEAAVRTVWASAAAASPPARMAVLVQPLIDARVAGVMFTVDPVSGSWREMTVEAVWGIGESLVSGEVVPDRYRVRRPRRSPRPVQRALARVRVEKLGEQVASQPVELVMGPGKQGVVRRATEAPHARKLVADELEALCRLGLRAESLLGGPQDVEWALDRQGAFMVLQSRPITAAGRLPRGGSTLWTRRFLGERFPHGASPLGWSILEPLLTWFIGYPETSARYLGGDPPFRVVRGHPYLNATVFRHLAFKWPGFPPPRFMTEFFPPDEAEAWARRPAAPADLRVYASILGTTFRERRWERFRWNPFANPAAWREFLATLDGRLAGLAAAVPSHAIAVAEPILVDYVKVHITSLLFANLWWQWTEGRLSDEDRAVLLAPPDGSVTARINRELRDLDPSTLDEFLARHGHRSDASWELFSRRWKESPAEVLALAAISRRAPPPAPPADVRDRLRALPLALRFAVGLARDYLALREEQRWHLDRILCTLKEKLLLLGETLFPDDPSRVRWLRQEELGLPTMEARRVAEIRSAEAVDPRPADFLRGDEALPIPSLLGARLQGLGISPGVARGRVRVLRSPAEGERLLPGEILVTHATDPAWTPLFGRAGGLVLELGSMLSHGAVVAREYRLPAVANVIGATTLLLDGEELTIDGRTGALWLTSRAAA